jgi:hypothetical protein
MAIDLSSSGLRRILQSKEPPVCRSGGSEGSFYVRTVNISVQTTRVVITICRGDETVVVVIPI